MSVDVAQTVGYAAGALTTACVIPQIVQAIRSGSTRDISYLFIIALVTGLALWLTYGIIISQIPVIVPNAISLALNLVLLGIKSKQDLFRTREDDTQVVVRLEQ